MSLRMSIGLGAAALAAGALWSGAAFAQEGACCPAARKAQPALTVSAEGQVDATPDHAVVRLGAEVQAEEAAAAQRQVDQAVTQALQRFQELGIPKERIQTQGLSLSPVYTTDHPRREHGQTQAPRIVAYRASNLVSVEVRQLDRVGRVVDAGVQAGLDKIQGISFGLTDDGEAYQRALKQAAERARREAETLASALGVRIARVLTVDETGGGPVHPYRGRVAMAAQAEQATPIEPGQLQVTANVTVRYALEGAQNQGQGSTREAGFPREGEATSEEATPEPGEPTERESLDGERDPEEPRRYR